MRIGPKKTVNQPKKLIQSKNEKTDQKIFALILKNEKNRKPVFGRIPFRTVYF